MLVSRGSVTKAPLRIAPSRRGISDSIKGRKREDDEEMYTQYVEAAYEERMETLQAENQECRELLQAVQIELDELLTNEDVSAMDTPRQPFTPLSQRVRKSQSAIKTPLTDISRRKLQAQATTPRPSTDVLTPSRHSVPQFTPSRTPGTGSSKASTTPSAATPVAGLSNEELELPMEYIREEMVESLQVKFTSLREMVEMLQSNRAAPKRQIPVPSTHAENVVAQSANEEDEDASALCGQENELDNGAQSMIAELSKQDLDCPSPASDDKSDDSGDGDELEGGSESNDAPSAMQDEDFS